MTLTFCWDLSAADWIVLSDLPWDQLVCFGPDGFDSYARLRFLPDPVRNGQSENDAERDERPDQLPDLLEVMATQTATPDDCYFCVWEGFGTDEVAIDGDDVYLHDESATAQLEQSGALPGYAPSPVASRSGPHLPKVVVPNRAYWLFRGTLGDVGRWDTAAQLPEECRLGEAEPAFIWPADHAWCVARDVDPHWAGIGGTPALITQLMTDPRLDVVPTDPTEDPPFYR
ncbi:MAG: hypothetical protein ACRDV2_16895 [Actinomycetes bacterium]